MDDSFEHISLNSEEVNLADYHQQNWHPPKQEPYGKEFAEIRTRLNDIEFQISHVRAEFEQAKASYKVKKFFGNMKGYAIGAKRRLVKNTFRFRVRQRRHFYRYHIYSAKWESGSVPRLNSHMRVVFEMTPNWIGRKFLRYPVWKEGYYGHPGEWRRMVSMNSEAIPEVVIKELDTIYDKIQMRELVGRK